jgi:hypothetical protein
MTASLYATRAGRDVSHRKKGMALLHPTNPCPLGKVRVQWLCLVKRAEFKSEARNPKFETIFKIQMIKTIGGM